MNKLLIQLCFAIIAISVFGGCAAKVSKNPKLDSVRLKKIALLPVSRAESIQRERAQYLHRLLALELIDRGYIILDTEVTDELCRNESCESWSELVRRYELDGIARFSLVSISRVNFVAGYTHALEGSLSILDRDGTELFLSTHTERQQGGVVFDSGQVIQGIIDQARSDDDTALDVLSARFVRSLTEALPQSVTPENSGVNQTSAGEQDTLELQSVSMSPHSVRATAVCAAGTANQSAWLLAPTQQKAQLREIRPGYYCGVFRLEGAWAPERGLQVELRAPFGKSVRRLLESKTLVMQRSQAIE